MGSSKHSVLRHVLDIALRAFAGFALLAGMQAATAQGGGTKAQEPPEADARLLREQLGKGGYVIYFRHAATDTSGTTEETVDLAKCDTQRNLSAQGRAQAREIGAAFRTLRIPVGAVITSPFCRCKDTGQLAFGKHSVSNDLYFAISVGAEERKRLTSSLRRMLSTPPAAGTNTVLVSHTANLSETAGLWPKPEGVAYIFRPLPGGGFEAVARMLPEAWSAAAGKKPPAR